jgi:hypothetical protein
VVFIAVCQKPNDCCRRLYTTTTTTTTIMMTSTTAATMRPMSRPVSALRSVHVHPDSAAPVLLLPTSM